MQIQINSPHERLPDPLLELMERTLANDLSAYAQRLTRVEVHVQDMNANKGGIDKRCMIEARPRGQNPVAVDDEGARVKDAFRGALDKLQRALEHRFGRQSSRGHEK